MKVHHAPHDPPTTEIPEPCSFVRLACFLISMLCGVPFFLGSSPVFALDPRKAVTQYVRTVWTTETGLPQDVIFTITQTHDGYLWFGTYEGLVRFDGVRFTVFDRENTPEIRNNRVTALCEDRDGKLWIGTGGEGVLSTGASRGGGLICFKGGKFQFFSRRDGLTDDVVRAIIEDREGNLWIGTSAGLVRLTNGAFTTFTVKDGLAGDNIKALYEDRQGTLWIGTAGGLTRRADGKFTAYTTQDGLADNYVLSLCEDRGGSLWIGSMGGLSRLKGGKLAALTTADGFSGDKVTAIHEDQDGNLWIGAFLTGLYRFRDGQFTAYTVKDSCNNAILSFYEDREGSLWVGTGNGLERFRDGACTTYSMSEGLSERYVYPILEDRSGVLWIGTNGGGLQQYKDGKFKAYTVQDGLVHAEVYSLHEDRAGRLWVGTNGGLSCLQDGKFTNYTEKEGLPKGPVRVMAEDAEGSLWIGVGNDLTRFKDGTFTLAGTAEGFSGRTVLSMYLDRQETLWIGTNGGLAGLRGGEFRYYTTQDGLSDNNVRCIYQDREGIFWIGTAFGLNRFKDGKFAAVTLKDGLFDNVTHVIFEDRQGKFWMSCNRGIYCTTRQELEDFFAGNIKAIRCTSYDTADGMRNRECNGVRQPAGWKTRDGRLWFPTGNGAVAIDPEHLKLNVVPPPVVIESVLTDNRTIALNESAPLAPGKERFEFRYTALSLLIPERVKFKYQLEGFDTDWVDAGTRRTAYYTHIPPGSYTFKVMACNNDQVWNTAGAAFHFRLLPPLWRTWWAYLLYAATVAGSIYGGVRVRLQTLQRRNLMLEAKVGERTAELAQAVQETERKNEQLTLAKKEVEHKNRELDAKIKELAQKNEALTASHQQADRIFSALAEALPGTVLDGKYRLDERIGTGGFGAVFRATHLGLNRPIAVKVFRPTPGNDSPEAVERFRLEGVSATRINHPNAIAVLDSGISTDGIAYLVMELLEGHSLATELRSKGTLTFKRCVEIIEPICSALTEAHRAGIVHRDIKPDNIFLHQTREGEVVKVVDFGIAKLMGETTETNPQELTGTGNLIGTPTYMAPERLSFKPYDGRADVYSLGVTLYAMLCGQVPFQTTERGLLGIIMRQINDTPPPLRTYDPIIPVEVETVVMSALQKDPALRPTAREFAEAFAKAVARIPEAVQHAVRRSGHHIVGSGKQTDSDTPTMTKDLGQVTTDVINPDRLTK